MTSKKRYYVNFGPELLTLLGPNLYTNIYYVLGELIANSYDADAHNVYIIYNTKEKSIIVEDDGHGMTYDQINKNFLPVGIPTRYDSETSFTESGERRKMGRKGIGKLGSLTVSDRVKIITKRNGVKSGCILSLNIKDVNGKFEIPGIPEEEITFNKVKDLDHGSAIIMENCKYTLNKTMESAKKNISLIFPFISSDFRIHLINTETRQEAIVDDYSKEIVKQADTLITFSDVSFELNDQMNNLHQSFYSDRYFHELERSLPHDKLPEKKTFQRRNAPIREELPLENREDGEKRYPLVIAGWIATFETTVGKNKSTDFPPAHLSLISNGKMGELNIIPHITQNRVNEAYVVGQLYVDLLELSELPDISLSNRQGYKDDDVRYVKTLELALEYVLKPILNLKTAATDYKNYGKKLIEKERLQEDKNKFDLTMSNILSNPSFNKVIQESPQLRKELQTSWNLKNTLKKNYKKIMISHCGVNKDIVDEFEKILHFCEIEDYEIIYTSSDHEASRFDTYEDIFNYLKKFFVNTTYSPNLCVIYILNREFANNWNTTLEAGAGWVLKTKSYCFFTDEYESVREPIKSGALALPRCSLQMDQIRDIQNLASAILKICAHINRQVKSKQEIITFIKTTKLFKE